MNYADTLVRIERPTGSSLSAYDIPLSFFGLDSFQVTASSLDKDSKRDANGKLKRNVLNTVVLKAEWNTPLMYMEDFQTVMAEIRKRYFTSVQPNNKREKKVRASVYCIERDQYITSDFYVPDITPQIHHNSDKGLILKPVRIALIDYGYTLPNNW